MWVLVLTWIARYVMANDGRTGSQSGQACISIRDGNAHAWRLVQPAGEHAAPVSMLDQGQACMGGQAREIIVSVAPLCIALVFFLPDASGNCAHALRNRNMPRKSTLCSTSCWSFRLRRAGARARCSSCGASLCRTRVPSESTLPTVSRLFPSDQETAPRRGPFEGTTFDLRKRLYSRRWAQMRRVVQRDDCG